MSALTIRHVVREDKTAWYSLDHDLPESGFAEKVRNRQGYVCLPDGAVVGILRYNLFWDSIPFRTMLHIGDGFQGRGYGRRLFRKNGIRSKKKESQEVTT